jgi:4-hydroxy-tetrahydrodipicolinate reductase
MTRVAIAGAGRMGLAIARLAEERDDVTVTAAWARDPDRVDLAENILVSGDLAAVVAAADVLIDFSLPAATSEVLAAVLEQKKALVCGVSGLDESQMSAIEEAAKQIPLLYDRNMSQGIAVLDRMVQEIAASLGDEFAIEIHETHHVHKKDQPSGTALKLGESIGAARGDAAGAAIQYHSERTGEVPGDHRVVLSSASERLELSHSVTTRDVFAAGAIRAAIWLKSQKSGLFSMRDVLFTD